MPQTARNGRSCEEGFGPHSMKTRTCFPIKNMRAHAGSACLMLHSQRINLY